MKIITLSILSALTLGAGSAASSDRLSDAEYIALGRCAGLAAGLDHDTETWRAAFRAGSQRRSPMANDLARQRHDDARRLARAAASDEARRDQLVEELQGRCAAFVGSPS